MNVAVGQRVGRQHPSGIYQYGLVEDVGYERDERSEAHPSGLRAWATVHGHKVWVDSLRLEEPFTVTIQPSSPAPTVGYGRPALASVLRVADE